MAATAKALIRQLASDGKLLDKDSQPIAPESGGDHTWAAKLAGTTRNVFKIRASELIDAGQGAAVPGGTDLGDPAPGLET